jgi:tetratricopeptide (TPR) repeat protein
VLGLHEEWLFSVGGLSLAPDGAGGSEAERLFLERESQATGGREAGHTNNIEMVRTLCRLVDGMPLAIELAAGLRRYLEREEIAAQIASDVEFLQAELRNVPTRHRSIPGLLEASVRRLTVEQMRALLSLSVFEGSFEAGAAAAIAEAPLRTLGELVDRSLVQPGEGRFALHPLLRQFARARLGPAWEELQARHAAYFLGELSTKREDLTGRGQVDAVIAIDRAWHDIAAAWRFACSAGQLDLIARCVPAAYLFGQLRARWLALRSEVDRAIAAAEAGAADELLAHLLLMRAWGLVHTSRGVEVQRLNHRAERLLEGTDAAPLAAPGMDPVAMKSLIAWAEGNYPRMAHHAARAVEQARVRGDELSEAYGLWLEAAAGIRQAPLTWTATSSKTGSFAPEGRAGRETLQAAGQLLRRAAELLDGRGEQWLLASVRLEQSNVAEMAGDAREARACAEEALRLRTLFEDWGGMAVALIQVADVCLNEGNAAPAAEACERAAACLSRLADVGGQSELERSRGRLAWLTVGQEEALPHFTLCVELSLRANAVNNVLAALRSVGQILAEREDHEAALEVLEFVTQHPGTTPFSRAQTESALAPLVAALPAETVRAARERTAAYDLALFARGVVASLREAE